MSGVRLILGVGRSYIEAHSCLNAPGGMLVRLDARNNARRKEALCGKSAKELSTGLLDGHCPDKKCINASRAPFEGQIFGLIPLDL